MKSICIAIGLSCWARVASADKPVLQTEAQKALVMPGAETAAATQAMIDRIEIVFGWPEGYPRARTAGAGFQILFGWAERGFAEEIRDTLQASGEPVTLLDRGDISEDGKIDSMGTAGAVDITCPEVMRVRPHRRIDRPDLVAYDCHEDDPEDSLVLLRVELEHHPLLQRSVTSEKQMKVRRRRIGKRNVLALRMRSSGKNHWELWGYTCGALNKLVADAPPKTRYRWSKDGCSLEALGALSYLPSKT